MATPERGPHPAPGATEGPLSVGIDTRELDAGEATGVGRYIRSIVASFRDERGVRVRTYDASGPPLIGPQIAMPARMRADGVDVIHGPANSLPLLPVGIPEVVTIHDLAIYEHPEWFPSGQWFAVRVVVPQSVRRARAIISPSAATKDALVRHFGVEPGRIQVIPHGVETVFALPSSASIREELRARFGLPPRYLLQVGTIQPRKNYVTTLRALARIPPEQRLPLIAVGGFGWGYEPVVDAVRELDLARWVRFVGYAAFDDLPALYQMAEAALFPSLDEGFGLPVLEAFAAGTPMLASNAGAIPEVAGEAALLSDPRDDAGLAANLQRVTQDADLRQRLVAAGRARAALFTWAASAAAHRQVYESAVSR